MKCSVFFVAIFLIVLTGCGPSDTNKPNIILISLDALRSDHVTCYGYERSITPTLDSLAMSGVMFSRCQAQAPRTLPSHASIFTGLSVVAHGTGTFGDRKYDWNLPSIQQTLGDNGYVTASFGNVIYFSEIYGFDEHFDYSQCNIKGYYEGAGTFADVRLWIDEQRSGSDPFFAFIHIFEIHQSYDPPEPFDRMFTENGSEGIIDWVVSDEGELLNPEQRDHLVNLYDGEIAYTDHILGEFLSYLRSADLTDSTLVIVLSDHGDEFLEHDGWSHGQSLYQELLHVPLIISGPGIPVSLVDSASATHMDIFPTILDYINIPVPVNVQGLSLLSDSLRIGRSIPSNGLDPQWPGFGGTNPDACYLVSILKGNSKLIMHMQTGVAYMYDLKTDSMELEPMPVDSSLRIEAELYWSSVPQGHPALVDTSLTNDVLRDLGYIR